MLKPHLPSLDDIEGHTIPAGFPRVIDAHVHVFPDGIFKAVRRWFDQNAWHIRYQLSTSGVFDFLLSHGVGHIVALQYAHAPGIAGDLNGYLAEKCRQYPDRVTGLATVFPGEENAGTILQAAFDAGLGGLKLHAHVQCFDINAADTEHLFDVCQSNNKPVVVHFGKEPKSPVYRCDPYTICSADKLARVLVNFPKLALCVPHLGFSETREYKALIEKYDNLWLDTTMVLTDYFHIHDRIDLKEYRLDRIMYGSDFPNIPYAWDRELKWLWDSRLNDDQLDRILNKNAAEFFHLDV
jgi:predicted TIM-barrel fold metal-dependent hydrolase